MRLLREDLAARRAPRHNDDLGALGEHLPCPALKVPVPDVAGEALLVGEDDVGEGKRLRLLLGGHPVRLRLEVEGDAHPALFRLAPHRQHKVRVGADHVHVFCLGQIVEVHLLRIGGDRRRLADGHGFFPARVEVGHGEIGVLPRPHDAVGNIHAPFFQVPEGEPAEVVLPHRDDRAAFRAEGRRRREVVCDHAAGELPEHLAEHLLIVPGDVVHLEHDIDIRVADADDVEHAAASFPSMPAPARPAPCSGARGRGSRG